MAWIWERPNWPQLTVRDAEVAPLLADVELDRMRFLERMETLDVRMRDEAALDALALDAVKSSEI